MIGFFRKIRQNLLMENKTGKYLKYAIGEIILVVIGILIALQINNWNENQKKLIQKKDYMFSLTNDYQKDRLQLTNNIKHNKDRLEVLTQYFDELENTIFTTPKEFISLSESHVVGIRIINTYNTNSYDLLISSGNIVLLDKDLQESIMELNRLQDHEKEVTSFNRDYFSGFMSNYSLKYPVETPNESLNQILWEGIETKGQSKDLIVYFDQERYTLTRFIELSERVLLQTELTLNLLEKNKN
jgi:hypothetical protein